MVAASCEVNFTTLLQIATDIYTKYDSYLLKTAADIIAKYDSYYYKMRQKFRTKGGIYYKISQYKVDFDRQQN